MLVEGRSQSEVAREYGLSSVGDYPRPALPRRGRRGLATTLTQTLVHVEITFGTDSGPAAAVGAITDFGQLTFSRCGPIMFPLSEPRNWRVTI